MKPELAELLEPLRQEIQEWYEADKLRDRLEALAYRREFGIKATPVAKQFRPKNEFVFCGTCCTPRDVDDSGLVETCEGCEDNEYKIDA